MLATRDILELTGGIESTVTLSEDPVTTLTVTRDKGAVLIAGGRRLDITEDWIQHHGLVVAAPDAREAAA